jgi:miniconductance mechanosensitive channel
LNTRLPCRVRGRSHPASDTPAKLSYPGSAGNLPAMMTTDLPWLDALIGLSALILLATLAHFLTRALLLRVLHRLASLLPGKAGEVIIRHGVLARLAYVVPLLVISLGIGLVPALPGNVPGVISTVTQSLIFVVLAWTVSAILNVANALYERRPDSMGKPIKGYLQMVRIILFIVFGLLILGTLLDRDVLTLLAGLGAVMAIILLIFQTTILSLVASVQVSSYDMVRVGDWIEMPALNADGDVIDISLHTIKVKNWDKTITTIPTNRLLTETFKNWRGMHETGGRRIKRALMIDQTTVRFLTEEERQRLRRLFLLDDYLRSKEEEIETWNRKLAEHGRDPANTRRLTNLGTFRAYALQYLENHPGINHGLTTLVRQQDPTPEGIPLELWCFTASTVWKVYESTQADIFDHLLAILPEFGLRVFQHPSGVDWREGIRGLAQDRAAAAKGDA